MFYIGDPIPSGPPTPVWTGPFIQPYYPTPQVWTLPPQTGWKCPGCERCYNPATPACLHCGPKERTNEHAN